MKFELLNGNRIKVTVSVSEQEKFGVSYETMDYSDGNTRKLCEKIIEEAGKEVGFQMDDGKLLVEARQCCNGNVALYLSRIPTEENSMHTYEGIVKFESSNDMLDALKTFARFHRCIKESKLYFYNRCYYIYFQMFSYRSEADELWYSLLEYGNKSGQSRLSLSEYAECISENLIGKIFSASEIQEAENV